MRLPGPLTTRAFGALPSALSSAEAGGAGGSSLLRSLEAQDRALKRLNSGEWPLAEAPEFVRTLAGSRSTSSDIDVDVAVCGGTLGIILACALQLKGHRVAVVEAGPLRGRAQDWNTSEEELRQLVAMGVLTDEELRLVAPLSFGPMSCRFGPSPAFELKLQGVLDVGVSPVELLRCVRARFVRAGGLVLERTPVLEVRIHADGAELLLSPPPSPPSSPPPSPPPSSPPLSPPPLPATTLHSRLVIDCMGHRSPIALQQRAGQRPDGVCVQVGSCIDAEWAAQWQRRGDFFVTDGDAVCAGPNRRARVQYFWQAFPSSGAASERSTYLFTYLKPGDEMPGLLEVMELQPKPKP